MCGFADGINLFANKYAAHYAKRFFHPRREDHYFEIIFQNLLNHYIFTFSEGRQVHLILHF